jgi:hypothetical protein
VAKPWTLLDKFAEAEHVTLENSIKVNLENLSFVLKVNIGLVHNLVHKDLGFSRVCQHLGITSDNRLKGPCVSWHASKALVSFEGERVSFLNEL